MTPEVARETVRDAAALLDRTVPGWAARVNPNILDLTSCTTCVLGQVFAADAVASGEDTGWWYGMDRFDLWFVLRGSAKWRIAESFAVDATFRELWLEAITDRLCADQAPPDAAPVQEIAHVSLR